MEQHVHLVFLCNDGWNPFALSILSHPFTNLCSAFPPSIVDITESTESIDGHRYPLRVHFIAPFFYLRILLAVIWRFQEPSGSSVSIRCFPFQHGVITWWFYCQFFCCHPSNALTVKREDAPTNMIRVKCNRIKE